MNTDDPGRPAADRGPDDSPATASPASGKRWWRAISSWITDQDASAVRSACALGLPLAIGVLAGRPSPGGLAAIGAFTALYTHNRPYRQRLRRWAYITVLLLVGFAVGELAAGNRWAAVITIGGVAAALTYLMKVVAIGPPAAYILVLVCATGTHSGDAAIGSHLLLVFAGAVGSLLVCSAGWPIAPDAPERRAVSAAMRSVARYLPETEVPVRDHRPPPPALRHAAYRALHEAALAAAVGSHRGDPGRLASVVRELRQLVDHPTPATTAHQTTASAASTQAPAAPHLRPAAADLQGRWPFRRETHSRFEPAAPAIKPLARALTAAPGTSGAPLKFPGPLSVWKARSPRAVRSGLRAGIAATAAGCAAIALQVDHPYWGATAAVAVLANDGTRATLSRAWSRFAGTVVGVLVAAGIIALRPSPAAIVAITVGLQLVIELVVKRSYGLAVVAITPLALLVAGVATGSADPAELLPRLLETAIGCALALVARVLIFPQSSARHLPAVMADVDRRKAAWSTADQTSPAQLRTVRIRLECALLGLADAVQAAQDELRPSSATEQNIRTATNTLEETWPAVTLTPHPPGPTEPMTMAPSRSDRDVLW